MAIENNGAIIGVFGDVDNGKTTFLSKIFNKSIYEEDGITQKIRVLELNYKFKSLIFIDTPGHYSFSTVINKIIKISDINIVIIDILNGLSQNLVKILKNILLFKKNSIFLINKIDTLNNVIEKRKKINKIKKDLLILGFLLEENGGEDIICEISALKKIGIDTVFNNILLILSISNSFKIDFGYVLKTKVSKYMKFSNTLVIKRGFIEVNKNIYFNSKKVNITNIRKNGNFLKEIGSYLTFEVFLSEPLKIGDKFYFKRVKKKDGIKKKNPKLNTCSENFIFKTDCYSKYYAFKNISKKFNKRINFLFLNIGNLTPSDFKLSNSLKYEIVFYSEKKPLLKDKFIYFNNVYNIYKFFKKIYKKTMLVSKAKILKIFKKGKNFFCGCKILFGIFKKSKVEIVSNGKKIKSEVLSLRLKNFETDFVSEGFLCGMFLRDYKPNVGDLIYIYE